ncbi:hypothetical protein H312_01520 [Anncaliia algerae PRA339]|uniref:Uncharacterized protein n=1 Tax=Anncaliia algerae PRA339 TaxID=1288291 RepID=A0A059F222_9MICR|nr:hypothetical protein H312_01520 [Anncaliia algerae PRA339]
MLYFLFYVLQINTTNSFMSLHQSLEKKRKFDIPNLSDFEDPSFKENKNDGKKDEGKEYFPDSDSDFLEKQEELYDKVTTKDIIDSPVEEKLSKVEEIDLMTKKLNRLLGDDLIKSPFDRKLWQKLYEFLMEHLEDFMVDGCIGIEMHIKYFLCVYIVAFIPGEFVFAFPAFLPKLLPKKAFKIPIVRDILIEMNNFLRFVRWRSQKTLIIPFFIGKKNSLKKDLEIIRRIPDLIFDDPQYLFTSLFALKVNARGYEKFKKNEIKKEL